MYGVNDCNSGYACDAQFKARFSKPGKKNLTLIECVANEVDKQVYLTDLSCFPRFGLSPKTFHVLIKFGSLPLLFLRT